MVFVPALISTPTDLPTPAQHPPHPRKSKASANRPPTDRTASAPLPLSPREQHVCEYLSDGVTFEAIARHLNCSPAAARAYHRRALSKRQRTIAIASLEQGDSSAQGDRHAPAPLEAASAEQPRDCPSSVSDRHASASIYRCNRSAFHRPAIALPPASSGSALAKRGLCDSSPPSDSQCALGRSP